MRCSCGVDVNGVCSVAAVVGIGGVVIVRCVDVCCDDDVAVGDVDVVSIRVVVVNVVVGVVEVR